MSQRQVSLLRLEPAALEKKLRAENQRLRQVLADCFKYLDAKAPRSMWQRDLRLKVLMAITGQDKHEPTGMEQAAVIADERTGVRSAPVPQGNTEGTAGAVS